MKRIVHLNLKSAKAVFDVYTKIKNIVHTLIPYWPIYYKVQTVLDLCGIVNCL